MIVERAEAGDELEWEAIGERPPSIDEAARPPIVELRGRANGVEFSVGQAAMWRIGYSGGPLSVAAPTSGGTCSVVVLGQPRRSRTWLCWLVGLEMTAQPVEAALLDVHVRLQGLKASGPGGRLAPIVQLTLAFDQLTDVDVAERFLAVELLGLLNLFAGRRIVPAGMWADDESGRLRGDFRGRLIAPPRRMVTSGLAAYVTQAFAGWERMSEDDRDIARIAIGGRLGSAQADLETAIAMTAASLELLAAAWLPAGKQEYELTKPTVRQIKRALEAAVAEHAPGTMFAQNLDDIVSRMFRRPAADQVERLLDHFSLQAEEGEVGRYQRVRNAILHGRIRDIDDDDKLKATLTGHWALAHCVLARLGYEGPTFDERTSGSR